ncbi:MAG: AsmA family protein, partial [Pseudomonadota bacterium]
MSEDIAKPAKEKKYWEDRVVGVLKWLTILAVILFILLTVLSRLGGNSDVLKGSIEDYLTDATPYSASVTTLNNMNFFPDIIIDVQGVELREGADGTGEAAIRVEAAKVVIPFFDMLFSPGDFKDINVSNITARAGSLHAKPVTLEYLRLKDENENAGLELKGALGQTAFSGLVGVSASGASGKRTYSLGDEKSVNFDIGRLKLEGTLRNAALGGLKFENVTLSHGETKALRGNFDFKSSGDDMSLKGQARIEPGKSQLDFDIDVKSQEAAKRVTGRVDSGLIKVSDFNESGAFMKAVNRLSAILGSGEKKPLDLSGLDVDVAMDIKNINIDKLTVGSISAPLSIKDKVLKIGPLKGDIVKGALGGDIKIDASKSPAKMNNKITIRKLDYAYLQTQLAGKAEIEGAGDILIDLSSEGTSLDALMDNLSGKAGFVGGRAKMRSGLLNIWGGGLLKAIMPKFKES